jgi:hypothetical protein
MQKQQGNESAENVVPGFEQKIKELGARSTKNLPQDLIDEAEEPSA